MTGNPASASPPASSVESRALNETQVSLPTITVWKVGSPNAGNVPDTRVPPKLQRSAEALGYNLRIQAFPAEGFTERLLAAFADNQEPDILAIENYLVIKGINTLPLSFPGTASIADIRQALLEVTESLTSLEGPSRGWEFLFRTSRNHEAAKSLALQFVGCEGSVAGSQLTADLRSVVERIGHAYFEGPESSAEFNDPDRLQAETVNENRHTERVPARTKPGQDAVEGGIPGSGLSRGDNPDLLGVHVHEMSACEGWGNDHLAFVRILSTYESKQMLGRLTALLVLRNQEGEWRLLAASTDPISTTDFLKQIPKLASLLQNPWTPDGNPAPARLLTPQDGKAPVPPLGERFGNFEWQPSESGNVVAQVVEFAYNDDARFFIRFTSENSSTTQQISAGKLWMTGSLWRWRVWSVSDTGAVSFSESRSFPN